MSRWNSQADDCDCSVVIDLSTKYWGASQSVLIIPSTIELRWGIIRGVTGILPSPIPINDAALSMKGIREQRVLSSVRGISSTSSSLSLFKDLCLYLNRVCYVAHVQKKSVDESVLLFS